MSALHRVRKEGLKCVSIKIVKSLTLGVSLTVHKNNVIVNVGHHSSKSCQLDL